MPNVKELESLLDYGQYNPCLPSEYSSFFTGLQPSAWYWSSSTCASNSDVAWVVNMFDIDRRQGKVWDGWVWPVRGPYALVPATSKRGLILLFVLLAGSALWAVRHRIVGESE